MAASDPKGQETSSSQGKPRIDKIKLNHIAISVTNLAESRQFYRDVVGLKQIPDPFNVGRHAWFDLGVSELHVIMASKERIKRDLRNHLCLSVADMDAFIGNITSHDITYFDSAGNPGTINIRPDGVKQIYFTDPDGYWIEINDAF